MFCSKKRRPAGSASHDQQKPQPLTHAQARKLANAMLRILKRWFDAVGMHDIRKHNELAGQHAEIVKILNKIEERTLAGSRPGPIPEELAAWPEGEAILPGVEAAGKPPSKDILRALGASLDQYDELLSTLRRMAERCPENCFAGAFASETLARLEGMRADVISLLRMNEVELIESAEHFDPRLHRPIATCPRPEGATGDGEVKRIGLIQKQKGKERVIKPAAIVLYNDVKIHLK